MQRFRILILCTMLSLVRCSGVSAPDLNSSHETTQINTPPPSSATFVPTTTPSISASLPSTELWLTSTPTATITPTLAADTHLETRCLEIQTELSTAAELTGVLALAPFPRDYMNPAILLDIATGASKLLSPGENETHGHYVTSPGGQWLAYPIVTWQQGQISGSRLVVVDADGLQRATIPLSEEEAKTGWRGYWLDDQRLITWVDGYPFPTRVIDPFTGEEQVLEIGSDSWYYPFAGNEWSVPLVYDPTLRWLVYPGYITSTTSAAGEYDLGLLLEDRQAGKIIANVAILPNYRFPLDSPHWSPDGTQFAFVTTATGYYDPNHPKDEFFSADREGRVTRLTHLTDIYPGVTIFNYSWSPDGRKIAFWAYGHSSDQKLSLGSDDVLAVLDLSTQRVTDFCIPANNYVGPGSPPVWSPDGRQIVVANQDDDTRRVVLVDIAQGYAAIVVNENLLPVGWMVAP